MRATICRSILSVPLVISNEANNEGENKGERTSIANKYERVIT